MDGTLVDSERCSSMAIVDIVNHPDVTEAYVSVQYKGWELAEVFRHMGETFDIALADDIVEQYRTREAELSKTMIKENPGVRSTLSQLPCHSCIASNARQDKTLRSLKQCNLEAFFDNRVYSAYDIQKWKPDPALFLHAAKTEGHLPENCVVVEDSLAGLTAALAANMKAVFYNPHDESHSLSNVHSIKHFEELLNII